MQMTLGSLLSINAHNYPHREAVVFEDARATFGEFNERVNQSANALLKLGVKKGDHVGTLFLNCMEAVESFFALWRIGSVLVPLNFRLSPNELSYVVDHSDVSTILFMDGFEEMVEKITPSGAKVKRLFFARGNSPPHFTDFEANTKEQSTQEPAIEINEEDVAVIFYTAGTTGKSKGVVATHKNCVWGFINYLISNHLKCDRFLTCFPFIHAAAFMILGANIFIRMYFKVNNALLAE